MIFTGLVGHGAAAALADALVDFCANAAVAIAAMATINAAFLNTWLDMQLPQKKKGC
jgi:hypothetical protein